MKNILKRSMPVVLAATLLAMGAVAVSCSSGKKGTPRTNSTMYERHQSNKGAKVKSNIKVKGSNKSNGHTTRSY